MPPHTSGLGKASRLGTAGRPRLRFRPGWQRLTGPCRCWRHRTGGVDGGRLAMPVVQPGPRRAGGEPVILGRPLDRAERASGGRPVRPFGRLLADGRAGPGLCRARLGLILALVRVIRSWLGLIRIGQLAGIAEQVEHRPGVRLLALVAGLPLVPPHRIPG
jgi:hypothetical protein